MNAMLVAAGAGAGAAPHHAADEEKEGGGGEAGGKGKGKKAKEPVDVNKPKARDVQKFLATAAAMAGDDVEDALVSVKKDVEEVPTRDRIKKALPVAVDPKAVKGKAGGK